MKITGIDISDYLQCQIQLIACPNQRSALSTVDMSMSALLGASTSEIFLGKTVKIGAVGVFTVSANYVDNDAPFPVTWQRTHL